MGRRLPIQFFRLFIPHSTGSGSRHCLCLGIVTGVVGVVVWLTPVLHDAEERLGLRLLYRLRGPRPVPQEVVIVNMDHVDADRLTQAPAIRKWPRGHYARLIARLGEHGAAVIAADVHFSKCGTPDDRLLAQAIREAGNVVLAARIDAQETDRALVSAQRIVMPDPLFADVAAGCAPFPLPKRPVTLTRYWRFKTGGDPMPTLPVMAFHLFAESALRNAVGRFGDAHTAETLETLLRTPKERRLSRIRRFFRADPDLAVRLLRPTGPRIAGVGFESPDPGRLSALLALYTGDDHAWLNFYGPPGTIPTVPFRQVLEESATRPPGPTSFKGRAVFIGFCGRNRSDQKDNLYTPYSGPNGEDMGGVEVAATAFANLVENFPVRPLPVAATLGLLLGWGLAMGWLCRGSSLLRLAAGTAGLSAAYLAWSVFRFTFAGEWHPLTTPLFVQTPFALLAASAIRFTAVQRERKRIRSALGYYLPAPLVSELSENLTAAKAKDRMVHGVCLFSDVAQYTRLSERLAPDALNTLMNRYYEAIFEPVRREDGFVIDTRGDAMIAVWAAAAHDPSFSAKACRAALDIQQSAAALDRQLDDVRLPTRIGLHGGAMLLGNVGAAEYYNFNPIGDVVNTSARLETLNKPLGTRILVSREIAADSPDLSFRDLGRFRLRGKTQLIHVMELVCRREDITEEFLLVNRRFQEAIAAFQNRNFAEAAERLTICLALFPADGPSLFFKQMAQRYLENPPGDDWAGEVDMG